ncbi:11-beta-hydroxysteroid dehydrogenase-like 6 isoform X2 [Hevea brasiliensis]|uniref:11-beta-hydroxysteroid dehydrogenase-like 6 isoform X2 n=1 Tax=Hevea brasiliensis TaxID=3981 RepID=UPI0025FA99BF|nr:11-beta-hydroxysteroid dehydrogenase-like 6 isoform X2 [Hevea brasiliensis]
MCLEKWCSSQEQPQELASYEYAKRGACLVLVDIKEDRLGAVVEKARNLGSPDVIAVGADVSKVEDSERFVRAAVDHFGRLDHLVNNAGIGVSGQLKDMKNLLPRRVMDVNFWGTIYSTHFALPHLTKSKGKIIVIASTLGWYPAPKLGFYVASKAAVINFYESLRSEIGGDVGITIVTPGLIKSEMSDNLAKKGKVDLIIPLESKEACAKAIVKSGCRGDKYLVEPSWIRVLYPCKVLYPEVVEFCNHWAIYRRQVASKSSLTQSPQPKIE